MYRNILVPIDPEHGPVGARILAVAQRLSGGEGQITLLTVVPSIPAHISVHVGPEMITRHLANARAELEALAQTNGLPASAVVVREGGASSTILDEAATIKADAIVLGSHRPDFTDYLLGSTSARVVRHARCTVVVERSAPV